MLVGVIEKKRLEMLIFAQKYGFTSERTIKCSQELDKLLNIVQVFPGKEDYK